MAADSGKGIISTPTFAYLLWASEANPRYGRFLFSPVTWTSPPLLLDSKLLVDFDIPMSLAYAVNGRVVVHIFPPEEYARFNTFGRRCAAEMVCFDSFIATSRIEIELVKGLLGVKSRFRKEPNFYASANRHHQRVIVYLCSDPDLIPQAQYIVLPGFQPHWQQRPAPIFE